MSKYIFYILFCITLLVHLMIRIYGLNYSPASINWDEASLGYSAYSLLETGGHDEFGAYLPLNLRSFEDYKPALYSYLSIPFVKFFGLSMASTRAVSAISGVMSLLAFFYLLNFFVRNKYLSLLFTFFIGFEPWRIHLSRTAMETNLSGALFAMGAVCLLYYTRLNKRILFGLSLLFLVLATYAYHSARLSVPLLLGLVFVDFVKTKKKLSARKIFALGVGFILLFLPVVTVGSSGNTLTRFTQENIFSKVYESGNLYSIYLLLGSMAGHAFAYLSPSNYGATLYHWIRNSVSFTPDFNVLGWLEPFFLLVGLYYLLKKLGKFEFRYLLYWFLAAIAPAVITADWFHILRALNSFIVIELVICLGILYLLSKVSRLHVRRLVTVAILFYGLFLAVYILTLEYGFSNKENNGAYQPGGFEQGWKEITKIDGDYDRVIIDTPHARGYIFMAFFTKYSPTLFAKYASAYPKLDDSQKPYSFGKYEFRKINWDEDKNLKSTILWLPKEVRDWELEKDRVRYFKLIDGVHRQYKAGSIVGLY